LNNTPQTISQILQEANQQDLYQNLIDQLNKDFNLSALAISIPSQISSNELVVQLLAIVDNLVHTNFEGFLSFLYRIDVSEQQVRSLPKEDFEQFKQEVSYLILKREWMKVWYRKKYS